MNKAIIIGNLGQDPEVRYTTSGAMVTNISVATTERWKDKNGERREETEWHRVVAFGKLAEIMAEYLKKGKKVMVEGRMKTDQYEKDGETRYSHQIIAKEMEMLDSREGSQNGAGRTERYPAKPQPAPADDFDEDIPF